MVDVRLRPEDSVHNGFHSEHADREYTINNYRVGAFARDIWTTQQRYVASDKRRADNRIQTIGLPSHPFPHIDTLRGA